MAFEQRIESLRQKHGSIEQELQLESHRPHPDDDRLHRLKREKLKIKDEISRLCSEH
jgi:hypothetical protein